MSEIRTPHEAIEAAAQAARNRVYRDSAGTGFDEDGFEADVAALASRIPPAPDDEALVAAAIEPELMVVEMVAADPMTLRRLQATRIARAVLAALRGAGALR